MKFTCYRGNTGELIKANCLLSKLTRSNQYAKTLQLFHQAHSSRCLNPDQYTLSTTLVACANLLDVAAGNQLHAHAFRAGFKTYPHVANTLLFVYARSGDLVSVKKVFEEIKIPDVYSWTTLLSACTKLGEVDYACRLLDKMPQKSEAVWNAVITGCAYNGHLDIALDMFERMHVLGVKHDNYSFASILSLCSPELIDFGREVHSLIIKTGFLVRPSVINSLVTMYFNCGGPPQACKVFEEVDNLVHDQITYNAMIAGLASIGRDEDALIIFKEMLNVGLRPTMRTFVSVMGSCSCGRAATQVHAYAMKAGFKDFISVSNAAMIMYSNCRNLHSAHTVFKALEEKDHISWNTIITCYAQGNLGREAFLAYRQMQSSQGIKPDEFTIGSLLTSSDSPVSAEMILAVVFKDGLISRTEVSNALLSAFSKHSEIEKAYAIFRETNPKNLISWNSMLSGFHSNGILLHCVELFSEMLVSGLRPDIHTLSIILSVSARISDFRHGKEVHAYILKFHYSQEIPLGNTLVTLYAKCGVLDWSLKVFKSMVNKDMVSWNSMIAAYAQNGNGKEAVQCFRAMQEPEGVKAKPDKATFTAVLSACSHAGLVDDGVSIFNSMVNNYGLEPGIDHFSCIIDLLGRAGYFDAAENLIKSKQFNVDSSIWWTLFSSCATHGNLRVGRIVAGFLLEAEEDKSTVYVLLSNILANAGHWEEAAKVRNLIKDFGIVKQPGYSWIRS